MNKHKLKAKTDDVIDETRAALQTVYDAMNNGQKKQILKDDDVAALFERYGVET